MSLINKMLQDLESRQEAGVVVPPAKAVYQGLRPVKVVGRRTVPHSLKYVSVVVIAAAGAYVGWNWWNGSSAGKPVPPVATAPATPKSKPAPVAASTPAPVPVAVAANEPVPATAPPVQVATIAPAVEPEPTKPEPQIVIPVPAAKPVTPSTSVNRVQSAKITLPSDSGVVAKRVLPQTAEDDAEARYRQALQLLEQGRSDEAARQLTKALAAHAAHVKARELLAGLALKNGHARDAQQLLEEGIAQMPSYYPFAQLLARLYAERGADQKALQLLEASAAAAGRDPDYHALLATIYQRVGRYADAAAAYGQVLEVRPQDARAWFGLGVALDTENKSAEAARAYKRARQSDGLPPSLATYAGQRLAVLNTAP